MDATLDCAEHDNDYIHWEADVSGSSTLCIFSGNGLLGTKMVTEDDVRRMCLERHDCKGYTVTTRTNYSACGSNDGCTARSYNMGRPEYRLLSNVDLIPVTVAAEGANRENQFITFVRK